MKPAANKRRSTKLTAFRQSVFDEGRLNKFTFLVILGIKVSSVQTCFNAKRSHWCFYKVDKQIEIKLYFVITCLN